MYEDNIELSMYPLLWGYIVLAQVQRMIFKTSFLKIFGWFCWKKNVTHYINTLKKRLGECNTCFGYETKTGVERILVIFQHRPMFSHINGKLSPRPLNDMAEHRSVYLKK